MTDEDIARKHGLQWNEKDAEKEYQKEQIRGTNARVLAAIAQARKEGHADGLREALATFAPAVAAESKIIKEAAQRCAEIAQAHGDEVEGSPSSTTAWEIAGAIHTEFGL